MGREADTNTGRELDATGTGFTLFAGRTHKILA
jgi:hypothetical protein